MYLVHHAQWDTTPAGALGGYALISARSYEDGLLGPLETHRVRAPLTIMSRADTSRKRAQQSIAQMRTKLEELLEKAYDHADEDGRHAINTYYHEPRKLPALDSKSVRTRIGREVWKARIPYPSIRSFNITRRDVLAPLEGVFLTTSFSPNRMLERYLTGAYALVHIDHERDIVVPTGRRAPEALQSAPMAASDIETYDPYEKAQIPEEVRAWVLERVEKSERAWLEKAPLRDVWKRYQELNGVPKRRIHMAQTKGPHGTWHGHLLGAEPTHESLAALARDHEKSIEDAIVIAGHSIGSDLDEWKKSKTKPFSETIRTRGRTTGYRTQHEIRGHVVLDTEHHARTAYPSLRAHDLESVAEHLYATGKTLDPFERRDLIERAFEGDSESISELQVYARDDAWLAYDLAAELLPVAGARSRMHNLAIEELAGASERKLSERFVERHRWLYAKRPFTAGREQRRFGPETQDWKSFSLKEHTRRLLTIEPDHGTGDVTILALHPYHHALKPLLSEVPSVGGAYEKQDAWVRMDLETLCSYPVFLLQGSVIEPEGRSFTRVFERKPEDLVDRMRRAENRLRGMLTHTSVYAASAGLIAIRSHDELERGLEKHGLTTRLAKGRGFVSYGRVIVADGGIHSVAASDLQRTSRGDYSREERAAIGAFEDTLITRGHEEALDALTRIARTTPNTIIRSDTARVNADERLASARTARITAHREAQTRADDRIEIRRLSGLWESERLVQSLRSAFEGLDGRRGRALIEAYLRGEESAREAIGAKPQLLTQ